MLSDSNSLLSYAVVTSRVGSLKILPFDRLPFGRIRSFRGSLERLAELKIHE